MDPREELRELIAQAREHLRYYSELGLTQIGEGSAPAAPVVLEALSETKAGGRVVAHAAPIAHEPKRQEPPASTIIPSPQFVPEPGSRLVLYAV